MCKKTENIAYFSVNDESVMANESEIRLPPIAKSNKRKSPGFQPEASTSKREKVIFTQNRFAVLSNYDDGTPKESEVSENAMELESEEVAPPRANKQKKRKPPPIILHGKPTIHKQFVHFIRTNVNHQFSVSNAKETVSIYLTDNEDWKRLRHSLDKEATEYHTFTAKEDKTHAFVLKGLDDDTTAEEVEQELKESNLQITKVYKMKAKRAMFLVITQHDVKLRHLQLQAKVVNYTRVSWERYYNKKVLTQCHRCQMWNHATSNCNAKPACLKCAEEHLTAECTKPRDTPAKCVNCEGDHPANSTNCPVYIKRIEKMMEQRNNRKAGSKSFNPTAAEFPKLKQRYLPAPLPVSNPWTRQDNENGTKGHQPRPPQEPRTNTATQAQQVEEMTPTAPRSAAHQQQVSHTTATKIDHQLNELSVEFKKLNSFVNLNNLLKAIRSLNTLLEGCQTPISKFETVNNFFLTIDSYGF